MRSKRPIGYALLSLAATALIVACAGRGGGALPSAPGMPEAGERAAARFPGRDLGRRDPRRPVEAIIALRFNDEAGLDRLASEVSDPGSARFRHFLTPAAFVARFSPTAGQQQRVVNALRGAGFTIVRTYSNRVLLEVAAPSGVAERFFATRIHDFDQPRYGVRFANVVPARVPASLASLVADVELDSLVYARAADGENDADDSADARIDVIVNGGFEQRMKGWTSCGETPPRISTVHPFAGRFDAVAGSRGSIPGEVKGWSAICQLVTIPNDARLVAHLYDETDNPKIDDSFQAVGLMTKSHKVVTLLHKALSDRKRWGTLNVGLAKYAGQQLYVFFGVHGRGQKKYYDVQYVDSVSLKGIAPTPTPSPTTTPTTTPTASPTPSGPVTPGSDAPLTGPTFGPQSGWAPRGVADGFDFPVQHGYAGTGVTVGIVMDQKAGVPDLISFYSYNKIASHGSVVYHTVGQPTPLTNDSTEVTLDVEAIAGLAPDADVIVYLTQDLSNQSILAAYNQVLSEGKVSILNSSFGECESEDAHFTTTSDQLAKAGAAMGITFVAAAGDEGSACYNGTTNVIGVNAPASGPHFLAVGGSQSLSSGSVANPAVWNDRTSGLGIGIGGGGISARWPLPAFQLSLAGSPASSTQRNVPDIALPAVNDDLFIFGTDQLEEGTSWSSSIATALLASGEEFCGAYGWVNPALYAAYASGHEAPNFIDVTSGFNGGYTGGLSQGYSAASGYDNASGIGMPNGISFDATLCGRTTTLSRSRGR